MITEQTINEIYKKFSKRPGSPDELNIPPLFEAVHPSHGIQIDEERLIINSLPKGSIFHSIPLKNINAILEFESNVAIVMHSSIIFLSKNDAGNYVHFKPIKMSFLDKLRSKASF